MSTQEIETFCKRLDKTLTKFKKKYLPAVEVQHDGEALIINWYFDVTL